MKLAHLADIHLGFRQYHRLTPQGINQREADVAAAFRHAVDGVVAAAPDLVVIAGDLFHSVRPSNPAILHAFNQLRRLREALPRAPIVIVAGNHDTPRSIETGTILRLFEVLGEVYVVTEQPRELVFDRLDAGVACVPHVAWRTNPRPTLRPAAGTAWRIAVTHGEIAGVLPPESWSAEYGGAVLEPTELHTDEWHYVALGHYHVAHQVRPNAWYAGALDYVSPNPWGELRDEAREGRQGQKGWLLVDLDAGTARVTFQPIPAARRLIDLRPIHATGLEAPAIDAQIAERVAEVEGGIENQIVRLVVHDIPRATARELDYAQIRELKSRALHFHLDLRKPPPAERTGVASVAGERRTLGDMLAAYLEGYPLPEGLPRQDFVALGAAYLADVEQAERAGEVPG